MHDTIRMTLRDTSDHHVSERFDGVFWQWLSKCVHVLFEILLKVVKDQPKTIFTVHKILQWANIVMVYFF